MKRKNRVIIFDWDDTICPSTFLDSNAIISLNEQQLLLHIAACADRCLRMASKYGHVIILTNADSGWVQYSAKKYLRPLVSSLETYTIISARSSYQKLYPNQSLCWKAAAIAYEVMEHFLEDDSHGSLAETSNSSSDSWYSTSTNWTNFSSETKIQDTADSAYVLQSHSKLVSLDDQSHVTNEIISFGDSLDESTAVKIVASHISAISKTIKFLPLPGLHEIIGQLNMITDHMEVICLHPLRLDLELSLADPLHDSKDPFA